MSEMLDDTMESLDDDEDELEDEAQEEVDKVLWQITDGKLGQADSKTGALPVSPPCRSRWSSGGADTEHARSRRRARRRKSSRRTRRWNERSRDCSARERLSRASGSGTISRARELYWRAPQARVVPVRNCSN